MLIAGSIATFMALAYIPLSEFTAFIAAILATLSINGLLRRRGGGIVFFSLDSQRLFLGETA
jgi:hypothetical protein